MKFFKELVNAYQNANTQDKEGIHFVAGVFLFIVAIFAIIAVFALFIEYFPVFLVLGAAYAYFAYKGKVPNPFKK